VKAVMTAKLYIFKERLTL